MKKVKIDFKNCYGIKDLEYEFDFSDKPSFVVYAPNGVMKTSFAKTFQDLSKGEKSQDRIHPHRDVTRIINDENNKQIDKEEVFVIEPYDQAYKSAKVSTLLASKNLKEQYDAILQDIDEKKEFLLKQLKTLSGLKIDDIEEVISDAITHQPKQFYKSLIRVNSEVLEGAGLELSHIVYKNIFNDKVVAFLGTPDFRKRISDYIATYDRLLSTSNFFKKGVFNHTNASVIAKNLKDNGFFKADHSVYLNIQDIKKEITTESELEKLIEQEKENIVNNTELKKSFEEVDKKITGNAELREFRDYLTANPIIIPELINLDGFKQKLWISYLAKSVEHYKELMKVYDEGKDRIEEIINKAKQEITKWQDVINIFNQRFSVPFVVNIENQDDVILKREAPKIKFEFKDNNDRVAVDEAKLLQVLSNGEKRALYILNIIFEVEARKEAQQPTLFVVDDIADSFDYKNKYAIIEYLKDISHENNFYQIILTHNFDFYRTISGRFDLDRKNKLHTVKSLDSIKLVEEKYQNNPFETWKKSFDKKDEMLIAAIPFVRNLADYCGHQNNFCKLTSLLHIKGDTDNLTVKDLETIFKEVLQDKNNLTLNNPNKKVKELIYELSDTISNQGDVLLELESKIVLSISIRLRAEEFLINKINDSNFVNNIAKNQTFALTAEYKKKFPTENQNIKLIDQVNLMTPENIHLNSFMYEPILDMSNDHLKKLYQDVRSLK